jgi:hypothetical protein
MPNELSKEEAEVREGLIRHLLKGPDNCESIVGTFKDAPADVRSVLQWMLIDGDITGDQLMDDHLLTDQSQVTLMEKSP